MCQREKKQEWAEGERQTDRDEKFSRTSISRAVIVHFENVVENLHFFLIFADFFTEVY